MAKRRTRKQKEKAKHQFHLTWKPEVDNASSEATVKGQLNFDKNTSKPKIIKRKRAYYTAQTENLSLIKRDIIKSLILASLILSLQVVIYLFW